VPSNSEATVDPIKPRFRWRIVPAWFLMGFGGVLSAASSLKMLTVLFGSRMMEESIGQCIAAALMCVAGICWFGAGRLILARRWKWMLLLLIIGYALGVSGGKLTESSRSADVDAL
jgi:hypothetical protein